MPNPNKPPQAWTLPDETQPNKPFQVSIIQSNTTLSQEQKAFNHVVEKIKLRREMLEQWELFKPVYAQRVATDIQPMMDKVRKMGVAFIKALDQALRMKGLSKSDKKTVEDIIFELADQYLSAGMDEPEIKAFYKKYGGTDYDEDQANYREGFNASMEKMFGIKLDKDHPESPDEILQKLQEKLLETEQARNQAANQQHGQRKKTAKQIAREVAAKQETEQVSQSLREIYRKLASALHPDREPDPAERERKTSLMQRVNQAYEEKNLLRLLELQLELEHIDARALAELSGQKLRHYIKILKEQLAEIDQEIDSIEMPMRMHFDLGMYQRIKPTDLLDLLKRDVVKLKADYKKAVKELEVVNDLETFKQWIKKQKQIAKNSAKFDDADADWIV
ncbi:MAG: J domain-containing protein [Rhodoferax sp.]|nr:J domain-containing protein [Rhodoferax sp.]